MIKCDGLEKGGTMQNPETRGRSVRTLGLAKSLRSESLVGGI